MSQSTAALFVAIGAFAILAIAAFLTVLPTIVHTTKVLGL